jgi:hypothetical protein
MKSVITFTTWLSEYTIYTRDEYLILRGGTPLVNPYLNEASDSIFAGFNFLIENFVFFLMCYISWKIPQSEYHNHHEEKGANYDDSLEDEYDYEDYELSEVNLKSDRYSKEPYTMNFVSILPPILYCHLDFKIETNHITYLEKLNLIGSTLIKDSMKNGQHEILIHKKEERIIDFHRESDPELLIIRHYTRKLKDRERGIYCNPLLVEYLEKIFKLNHFNLPSHNEGFYFETYFKSDYMIKIKKNDIKKFNEINNLVNKVIQKKRYLFYYTYLKHLTFRRIDCSLLYLFKNNELDLLHFIIQIHQYNRNINILTGEDLLDFYLYLIKAYFLKDREFISKIELLYYIDKIKMIYFLEKSKKEKIVLQKMYDKLKYNIFVEKEYLCVLKEKLNKFEEIVNREMKERSVFSNTNLFYFKHKLKKTKKKIKCL